MNKVSIITPLYNGAAFIQKCYDSIQNQTHTNFEWIVVDDSSQDGGGELLEKLLLIDSRVKLIRLSKNQGAAKARNVGIEASSGEFIAFLDIDDEWLPTKLSSSINFMIEKKISFSYTNYLKNESLILTPLKVAYVDLLKTCSICTSTVVIEKKAIGTVRMKEDLRRGQDYVFWLNVLQHLSFAHQASGDGLTVYHVGHESLSSNKFKKAISQWRIYREILKMGWVKSSYYFLQYAFWGLRKYLK